MLRKNALGLFPVLAGRRRRPGDDCLAGGMFPAHDIAHIWHSRAGSHRSVGCYGSRDSPQRHHPDRYVRLGFAAGHGYGRATR